MKMSLKRWGASLLASWTVLLGVSSIQPVAEGAVPLIHRVNVEFRVLNPTHQDLEGARIIAINDKGNIVATGLTRKTGLWTASIPLHRDLRFRVMGTITAIVIANGYNEQVVFEVPVRSDSTQTITLSPIQANCRSVPRVSLGSVHSREVARLVDYYAARLGLIRQPPAPGEVGNAPWSSELQK